jgi:hypothetical protein
MRLIEQRPKLSLLRKGAFIEYGFMAFLGLGHYQRGRLGFKVTHTVQGGEARMRPEVHVSHQPLQAPSAWRGSV